MFQNINESTMGKEDYKGKKYIDLFTNVLQVKNIPIYIIAFMMSCIGIGGKLSPFCISILGACISNSIPVLGVVLASSIGCLVKFGVSGLLSYILTALLLILTMFLIKPKYQDEEKNEKLMISKNVFIASFIIQIFSIGFSGFTLYDMFSAISFSIISAVFYKIFVNSVIAVMDFNEGKAFTVEEILGASLMIAIAIGAIGDFSILGLSIRNILCILIVLILGWKNGVLIGATSGITIGITLGVITNSEPVMIAAYAISGFIAGILNKFGRIGVVVGFCIGNIIIAYVANGNTVQLIHFREILIASIGLLIIPKNIKIDIEEFINTTKLLPSYSDGALNKSKETAERLNNVSETLQEMAKSYKIDRKNIQDSSLKTNKEIFISELLDNLNGYENNMLYEDLSNVNNKIVDDIFNYMIDKQEITREVLLDILANNNSFVVDVNDTNISEYLDNNITQAIRVINMSYKISKSDFIWKKKFEESKRNVETQLEGVSRAITNLANNIQRNIKNEESYIKDKKKIIDLLLKNDIKVKEISILHEDRYLIEMYIEKSNNVDVSYIEETLTKVLKEKIVFNSDVSDEERLNFLSDDKYVLAIGITEKTKEKSDVSGDSIINIRLKDGKYLVAISDGMGSGNEASQSSSKALEMLKKLILSGFDKNTSIELINSSLINQNEEIFATLDIAIIDLYKGNIEFIKSGACPTYIKNDKKVKIIKANSLPAGIINKNDLQIFDKDIIPGEILCMCSDGIIDSNIEYKNKELWIKYLLEDIDTNNTKKIADIILKEAVDNNYGSAKDDMSVIVCKFLEKE